MNNSTPDPTESGETMWMLLSLLCLPVVEQLEIIGGVPNRSDEQVHDISVNHAIQLLSTISQYHVSWLDEFESKSVVEMAELVQNMDILQSKEDFVEGDDWKQLRRLAAEALNESGMPLWPIPGKIDFNHYIEIVQ